MTFGLPRNRNNEPGRGRECRTRTRRSKAPALAELGSTALAALQRLYDRPIGLDGARMTIRHSLRPIALFCPSQKHIYGAKYGLILG